MTHISKLGMVRAAGLLALGLGAGLALNSSAQAAPSAGSFCSPKGGVLTTPTRTMICAQSPSDQRWRWRPVADPQGTDLACQAPLVRVATAVQGSDRKFYRVYLCGQPMKMGRTQPALGRSTTPPATSRSVWPQPTVSQSSATSLPARTWG